MDSRSILRGFFARFSKAGSTFKLFVAWILRGSSVDFAWIFSSFFSPFVVGNRWTAMVHNGDVLMKPAIGDSILSGKLAKDMGHNSYGELARANNLLGMRK